MTNERVCKSYNTEGIIDITVNVSKRTSYVFLVKREF